MAMDSSHMMSAISLVGSAASTAATAYFWITKFRRERPSLHIYPSDHTAERILGVYRGETRSLQFRSSAVVANYSALPNAIIAVELAMKRRDGSWDDIVAPRAAGLPLNVPSMTTVRLDLEWSVSLPALSTAEALRPNDIVHAYLDHYYAQPPKLGVSVWALGEQEFRAILPLASGGVMAAVRLSEAA